MHDKLWVDVTTGRCYSTRELIDMHPGTTFPVPFAPPSSYAPLADEVPEHDPLTQAVTASDLAQLDGDKWRREITVVDMPGTERPMEP